MAGSLPTVWLLGDQLHPEVASLQGRAPGECRILMVRSDAKVASRPWHRQRLHLVLSAMAHRAEELRAQGYEVDERRAPTLAEGIAAHRAHFDPSEVIAMEPMSWDGRELLRRVGVTVVPNNQFLCSYQDFAHWAEGRRSLKMEDFYRWQRTRLDVLMVDGQPVGGRWNFDDENRERPPNDGRAWPPLTRFELDDIDHLVLEQMPDGVGREPDGTWPVTRAQALARLDEFVTHGLGPFGPHEDAMLAAEWKMAHSCLSSSMNIGLLHPAEVVAAAVAAYERDALPLNSVEGFVRQVIGWREYVWGVYWLWMPDYRGLNSLGATRSVPPAFTGAAPTHMACVGGVASHVEAHGYAHHIERLMVLGNLALTAGVDPVAMTDWMWASFVDGAEWVMLPNVVGMALYADGGMMATKPYASGGAYIKRMSDWCKGCRYDPGKRSGPDACPFTTLYWDFMDRHRAVLSANHRMARQLGGIDRLSDLDATRQRAREVLDLLDRGEL